MCSCISSWNCLFDLQRGFTVVGHSAMSTLFPVDTRKSFGLIFMFSIRHYELQTCIEYF